MRHVFKLRSVKKGVHIHTTVFSGREGSTLANTGTLIQTIGEWQIFGALLKCSSELNAATKACSLIIFENDQEVVNSIMEGNES